MAKLDPKTSEWFINKPPIHWSRAFISSFSKCDVLLNNLCESFNSVILHVKDKHIWTMTKSIRIYLMSRLQKNREKMMKYCQRICSRIIVKQEKNKAKAVECFVTKSDQFHYQIEDIYIRLFSVDLKNKICSCRRWELIGIPYNHVIAAIWIKKDEPEMYVHEYYAVKQYLKSYNPLIFPIVSIDQWTKTGIEPQLPPIYKAQPSRPKKIRKRGIDETTKKESDSGKLTLLKASRKGRKKKCRLCGTSGYNSRKCPILMERNESEPQDQHIYQQAKTKGPLTPSNETEVSNTSTDNVASMQSSSSFVTE
ncbi:hypothetical protein P3S68_022403 [Capsicum galapagoense]